MSARDRILGRVRAALVARAVTEHPGPFAGWRPEGGGPGKPVEAFAAAMTAAGGEVVRLPDVGAAAAWLASFSVGFASAAVGEGVPPGLRPGVAPAPAETAELGVSMARAAAAETGTLLLDARDGRRAQLLPPVHVVLVDVEAVHATLAEALQAVRDDLPAAIGLHSGPSKSADIAQTLVKGVHGPGRLVAVVIGGA
jgi:L-lactate dehydrogenase complex protein LldG